MSKVQLRRTQLNDLAFVTALERHPGNRDLIGQWTDAEHGAAIEGVDRREHWVIERDGRPEGYLIAYDCRSQDAGFYVKRVLVADKDRGTGTAGLRAFVESKAAVDAASCVWLIVRDDNARAQAVYRKLGFERFDPAPEEARRFDAAAEPPHAGCFRMRRPKSTA